MPLGPRIRKAPRTAGRGHSPLQVASAGPQEAAPGCALRRSSSEREGKFWLSSDQLCPKLFFPSRQIRGWCKLSESWQAPACVSSSAKTIISCVAKTPIAGGSLLLFSSVWIPSPALGPGKYLSITCPPLHCCLFSIRSINITMR